MNWFLWFVVAWWALNALTAIVQIGKPRTPITPGVAAIMVVIFALLIAGVFQFGAHR